ncbi:amidohydrolase family protein [Clostridium sp. AM58-1XD]|uniref:amidohydrolase family protein n=1 Tax=Clostridium sp. AM58-1XD TaxID=2292307 RepID=UPI000E4E480F|nr:amidohydrolase family protein [Clostridium sp. AM58-1XD]RGY96187.1 hypothetical protein DXA13_17680 [Clostridium sp. AM58-1XD]
MTGINSPQRADDPLLGAAADLSSRYHLSVHCHLLETRWQKMSARKAGISPLEKLDRYSLLHEHTSLAHCIWMDDKELDLMAKRRAIPVSNPSSNLFLGSGVFPAGRCLERGILPALGSDGVNCASSNNMMDVLRTFLFLQRSCEPDWRRWISGADAWSMVTARGRQVLNMKSDAAEKNLLSPGQPADLAVADKNSFLNISANFLPNQLLFHNHPVFRHVMIGGKFVMKDGKITVIDEDGLGREIGERKNDLDRRFTEALRKARPDKELFARRYQEIFTSPG